jgi:hypothetical protein
MDKLFHNPVCKNCGRKLDVRLANPASVRLFLFWLPVKKYFCLHCRYVIYVVTLGKKAYQVIRKLPAG